jgi:sulfotransferase
MLGHMSGQNEFYVFISDEQRKRILKGVVENYYCGYTDAEVVFDTNRMWCSNLSEPPRLSRRLQPLRGLEHEHRKAVLT